MSPLPLNAVRVFIHAARSLSFKQAAAELFVTPGAVSRQIRGLEEYLGVALFARRHRAIVLTASGELFLTQVGPALERIGQAATQFRQAEALHSSPAIVRLDATPTFAMHWLIPRLASFRAQYPQIEVRLSTSQGVIGDVPTVDLHIRRDPSHFGHLSGVAFMDEYAVLVCRAGLGHRLKLDGSGSGTPLIRMRSRPDLWPKWLSQQPSSSVLPGFIEFDNTILAIQAAGEGLGIALVPVLFVSELLRNGVLSIVPGAAPLHSGAYHLLLRRKLSATGEIFVAWLQQMAKNDPAIPFQGSTDQASSCSL